jgi:hypothetical protein
MASERCSKYPPDDIRRTPYWDDQAESVLTGQLRLRTGRQLFDYVQRLGGYERTKALIYKVYGQEVRPRPFNRFCDHLYEHGVPRQFIPRARVEK